MKVTLELPQELGTDLQDLAIPPFAVHTQRILSKITEILDLPCSLLVYSEKTEIGSSLDIHQVKNG